MANVGAPAHVLGGFYLHAQEMTLVLDGEVVARGVSVRLGDAQSVGGGAGHETHLCPLTALFAVLDIDTLICHESDYLEMLVGMESGQ